MISLATLISSSPRERVWPHINGHAEDACVVSTDGSFSKDVAFVDCPEVLKGAPLMAKSFDGRKLRREMGSSQASNIDLKAGAALAQLLKGEV